MTKSEQLDAIEADCGRKIHQCELREIADQCQRAKECGDFGNRNFWCDVEQRVRFGGMNIDQAVSAEANTRHIPDFDYHRAGGQMAYWIVR